MISLQFESEIIFFRTEDTPVPYEKRPWSNAPVILSVTNCPRHRTVLQQLYLVLVPSQYCMDGEEPRTGKKKRGERWDITQSQSSYS